MNSENRGRLRTPVATESIHLQEAYRHHKLLRITEDYFSSWGYFPVLTPVFDYYETYRNLLSPIQNQRTYRFTDREGELLMLRSDITLFLAKQMGLSLRDSSTPHRLYYADSILRHQEEEDISSDEFFQSGAELIGLEGREGDMEILLLLYNLLERMELPNWRMHLGSRAILNAVLSQKLNPALVAPLLDLRDYDALVNLLSEAGLPSAEARAKLLFFLGSPKEFSESRKLLVDGCLETSQKEISIATEELVSLTSELSRYVGEENIHIDLSEHGNQTYYTGFTVCVYLEGASTAVATGGRYDELLGHFGSKLSAVGFSILGRKIEPLSVSATVSAEEMQVAKASGENFHLRYKNAVERRENGESVALS